jgi:hypothetical protein
VTEAVPEAVVEGGACEALLERVLRAAGVQDAPAPG